MKKSTLLILTLLCSLIANAQSSDKFVKAMTSNVAMLDTATKAETFQMLNNNFSRIADKEKTEWLPDYYMAYCDVLLSYMIGGSKTDDYCDAADSAIQKAEAISPKNSEIVTIKAWIASARIMVNPMTRGPKYGPLAGQLEDEAIKLDPANPRPYLLKGQGLFYTPPAFGGGKDKAKPVLQDAVTKYASFKPKEAYYPHWGADQAKKTLDKCQ